ncbi:helix-turn-helix transcriptional regulator [Lentzea tibetensis]|uniref:Helix-turn-helix transcriptional regulator n=1 Tax=Lentzea tibetensis TaxID=2591470 RepID=A0A563EF40_9PSEU|nr:helix-turn-helix domain-containing protein [Lentzea tibetensis]TWP44046.1 helix-turn-helix transcriptional regulator [Lentzea tibetensis]
MTQGEDLARLAGLLADRTRATFCLALLDGRAWTANELAAHADVAPSTASEHLTKLLAGGLLVDRRQGRHRYVQLADPEVAQLLEDLTGHLTPTPPRGLKQATAGVAMARARTCYDHLAGRLGVAITDALTERELLDQRDGFGFTPRGLVWLKELGADPVALRTKRPLAKACLDWTERRTHLGGTAGAFLCTRFQDNGWIRRVGTSRAVRLTPEGETALHSLLGIRSL